ncbi:MAG: DUF4446 family protein [Clostridia bacterium]|nr:DUF4446 family protein [Clostridia bacterium]MDQ7792234.1 DUF4446 family protein [Clostridia bacterium]
MPAMDFLSYLNEIILAGLGILLIISIVQVVVYRRMLRQQQRLLNFMRMHGGDGIGQGLENCTTRLEGIEAQLEVFRNWQRTMEEKLDGCVRTPPVLRYNAFDDIGSDLSFSVALLDAHGEGAVVTGLYSRTESRTYCKPVQDGTSTYPLTEEEQSAINQSRRDRSSVPKP